MSQKSLKINALLNGFKTIATLFFPLITFPYSSRILGPDNLGKVNFANSFVSYFSIIASLGIASYATREAAKVRDNREKLSILAREIFTINMIAAVVAYSLLFLSFLFVKKISDYKSLIIISSTLLLFTTIGMNWLYQALEEYFYITVRSLVFQIVSVVMLFLLVKTKDDYLFYAAINVVSNVGANICNLVHSRKYLDIKLPKGIRLEFRKHLKPIFILFAAAITTSLFVSIDTTMLGFMNSDLEVGLYTAGTKIVHMINGFFPAIISVLFPRLSYYFGNHDDKGVLQLTTKTVNIVLLLALPIVTGLFLLSEPMILLLCGENYIKAVAITKIMCPYIIFSSLTAIFNGTILVAMGKEIVQLYSVAFSAVANIILNAIFIYFWGARGAAFASVLAQSILTAYTLFYMRDFVKNISVWKSLIQVVISSLVMGISVYFVRNLFTNLLLQLFVPFVVGVLTYAIMLFVLRNRFFLEACGDVLGKFRKR